MPREEEIDAEELASMDLFTIFDALRPGHPWADACQDLIGKSYDRLYALEQEADDLLYRQG